MNCKTIFISLFMISFLNSCKKEELKTKVALKTENTISLEANQQIEKMLVTFYSSYLKEFSNENLHESERKLDSIKVKYCTKSLLDSISNEFENNGLDYDPFIKAQDVSSAMMESLIVKKISDSENKFKVQYFEKDSGNQTNIFVSVVNENGSFKISSLK